MTLSLVVDRAVRLWPILRPGLNDSLFDFTLGTTKLYSDGVTVREAQEGTVPHTLTAYLRPKQELNLVGLALTQETVVGLGLSIRDQIADIVQIDGVSLLYKGIPLSGTCKHARVDVSKVLVGPHFTYVGAVRVDVKKVPLGGQLYAATRLQELDKVFGNEASIPLRLEIRFSRDLHGNYVFRFDVEASQVPAERAVDTPPLVPKTLGTETSYISFKYVQSMELLEFGKALDVAGFDLDYRLKDAKDDDEYELLTHHAYSSHWLDRDGHLRDIGNFRGRFPRDVMSGVEVLVVHHHQKLMGQTFTHVEVLDPDTLEPYEVPANGVWSIYRRKR